MSQAEVPPDPDLAEADLIARLKIGDEDAFNELVKAYADPVFKLAFRLLSRNREEAEDVTQEVFLKAFRKIKQFRGDSALRTWLFRITSNCVTNRLKYRMRLKRRETLLQNVPDPDDLPEPGSIGASDPAQEYEKKERLRRIEEAVQALPEDLRRVVVLRDLDNFSYQEISSITSIPVGTVKSRIARGREALRKILKDLL